jgi:enoyl-CoA hydratase
MRPVSSNPYKNCLVNLTNTTLSSLILNGVNQMSYACFDVTVNDHIAHIQFNRPDKLNSMIRSFWVELGKAVRELDTTGAVRAVVITSTGKHFTAGMDLSVFSQDNTIVPVGAEEGRIRESVRRTVLELQDCLSAIEQVRMPVLAAIQGGCIGGGVDLVCACDMRYCTKDAFFCIQELNIGMTADCGTLQRLPKLIPLGIARELAYTGKRLPAARAVQIGFVNEIYEDHNALVDGVMQTAREIAEHSPLAVHGSKEMLTYSRDHTVSDSLNYMAAWQTGMFQPTDMAECLIAKNEKRKPVFENLLPLRKFDDQ